MSTQIFRNVTNSSTSFNDLVIFARHNSIINSEEFEMSRDNAIIRAAAYHAAKIRRDHEILLQLEAGVSLSQARRVVDGCGFPARVIFSMPTLREKFVKVVFGKKKISCA